MNSIIMNQIDNIQYKYNILDKNDNINNYINNKYFRDLIEWDMANQESYIMTISLDNNTNIIYFTIGIDDYTHKLSLEDIDNIWFVKYINLIEGDNFSDDDFIEINNFIIEANNLINNPKFDLYISLTSINNLIDNLFDDDDNNNNSEEYVYSDYNDSSSESKKDIIEEDDIELYSKISTKNKKSFIPDYSNTYNDSIDVSGTFDDNDYNNNYDDIDYNNDKDLFDDNEEDINIFNEKELSDDIIEEFDIIDDKHIIDENMIKYFSNFIVDETKLNTINWELFRLNTLNILNNMKNEKDELNLNPENQVTIILNELKNLISKKNNIKLDFYNDNLLDINIILNDIKLINDIKLDEMIINIKFTNLYPYYPINFNISKPLFKNKLNESIRSNEYFKLINWNPSNSILNLINDIEIILSKYGELSNENIDDKIIGLINLISQIFDKISLDYHIIKLTNNDIKYNKLTNPITNKNKNNQVWNNGVGYGNGNTHNNDWNIKQYLLDKEKNNTILLQNIVELSVYLSVNMNQNIIKYLESSSNIEKLLDYFFGTNMDLNQIINIDFIESFVDILNRLVSNNYKFNDMKVISKILDNKETILTFCKLSQDNDIKDIKILYDNFFIIFEQMKITNNDKKEDEFILKKYQYMVIENNLSNFMDKKSFTQITNKPYSEQFNKKHLMKELLMLKNSLPCDNDSGIYLCYNMDDISKLKVLIIPSESTPYAYGCFIFNIHICNNYPNNPPLVKLITTGNGSVRFNPNLYNCGKVCLSLLGTWSGQVTESWIPDQSTILQVLISIQSLIFVDDPYYNEPGYQTRSRIEASIKYNENIQVNNIRYAIIDNIVNPDKDFKDLIYDHFKLNKDKIINKVDKWLNEGKEKCIIDNKVQIKDKLMKTFTKYNI